jgi:hypothetical protein
MRSKRFDICIIHEDAATAEMCVDEVRNSFLPRVALVREMNRAFWGHKNNLRKCLTRFEEKNSTVNQLMRMNQHQLSRYFVDFRRNY